MKKVLTIVGLLSMTLTSYATNPNGEAYLGKDSVMKIKPETELVFSKKGKSNKTYLNGAPYELNYWKAESNYCDLDYDREKIADYIQTGRVEETSEDYIFRGEAKVIDWSQVTHLMGPNSALHFDNGLILVCGGRMAKRIVDAAFGEEGVVTFTYMPHSSRNCDESRTKRLGEKTSEEYYRSKIGTLESYFGGYGEALELVVDALNQKSNKSAAGAIFEKFLREARYNYPNLTREQFLNAILIRNQLGLPIVHKSMGNDDWSWVECN